MKRSFICLLVLLNFGAALAEDVFSMSMDEFYQIEEYKQMHTAMKKSGKIEQARAMLRVNCFKQAKDKKTKDYCECSGSVTDNVEDKLILFESIVAFKSFQAKVRAKQSGDDEEYQRLKSLDLKREGLSNLITAKCGELSP